MAIDPESRPSSPPQGRPAAPQLVGSVVQAAALLRCLARHQKGRGVTMLARELAISPSSCFNILKTLVHEDLATFDPATKLYGLGIGTVRLARGALGKEGMVSLAANAMEGLASRFDAAVGLWRLTQQERLILVALSESEAATRIHMAVGQRQPATAGATGRTVLAARQPGTAQLQRAFVQLRWQQQPCFDDFAKSVEDARIRGWGLDVDQTNRGVTTCAAAILDGANQVRFCLSASMFTGRDSPARTNEIGEAICAAAHSLAQAMGRWNYG